MWSEVLFKDGSICKLEKVYNWNWCYIYRTDTCYLIVPYKDVVHSRVSTEEYRRCQTEAKKAEPIKKAVTWTEVITK